MGNRRIGRKRLYGVEKKGLKIDLESSEGIIECIGSATQHRQGQELITEITVDLNPAAQTTKLGGATSKVVGLASTASAITQLTIAKFGVITEIRAVCVEALTDASDATVDVDIMTDGASSALAEAAAPSTNNKIVCDGLGVLGSDVSNSNAFHSSMQADGSEHFLYICNGASESKTTNMKTGKLIIYIHGFEVPADA